MTFMEWLKQEYPEVYKKLEKDQEALRVADKVNDFLADTEGEEKESDLLNRELMVRFLDYIIIGK